LQHQGDHPVRAGRPSLLLPDEQAATGRQGILSSLDGMQVPGSAAPAARPRSRTLAWSGAAAGALVAGAALFLGWPGDERQTPVAPSAAPAVKLAAAPVEAPRPARVATPAPAAPAPAVPRDAPAVANPLADLAGPPASVAHAHTPAPARPERHKAHAAKAARKEKEARAQHKGSEGTHAKTRTRTTERHPKAGTAREADSDVVLLAALVSHIEPKKGKATPAEQLEACRGRDAAGEAQCRARVCEKMAATEASCRRTRAAHADPET
jgi:hypothetical protein